MILPSKHLPQERALLTVGARILNILAHPKTVSALWVEISKEAGGLMPTPRSISYDWFVLALDLLFALGAINLSAGLVTRSGT